MKRCVQNSHAARWQKYITATGAVLAGVSAEQAQAGILYSGPVNLQIDPSHTIYFNLNQSHPVDASSTIASTSSFNNANSILYFYANSEMPSFIGSTDVLIGLPVPPGPLNTTVSAAKLSGGDSIGSNSGQFHFYGYMEANNVGPWQGGGQGYLGLRINGAFNQFHYGWARINYDDDANRLTLFDFAYETTLNKAILAGAGIPTPEPSGIFLAALGVAGLTALRARRKKPVTLPTCQAAEHNG